MLAPRAWGAFLRRHLPASWVEALQRSYSAYHRRVVTRWHRRWLDQLTTERPARVQGGPFAGMRYGDRVVPAEFVSKWLGAYEQELHPWIERLCARPYRQIVNIGCAEGYYAVGLALRLPRAQIEAFDLDPDMVRACQRLAEVNGVQDRLRIGGGCTPSALDALIQPGDSWIFCDCEGAERELLDPARVPGLAQADLLVEVHDFIDPTISTTLQTRFAPTHSLQRVASAESHPEDFPALGHLSARAARRALDEYRPGVMEWFLMEWNRPASARPSPP